MLFPTPDGPMIASFSPGEMQRLMRERTFTPGSYSNDTSLNSMPPKNFGAGRERFRSLTSLRYCKTSTIRSAPTLALVKVFAEREMAFMGV